MSGIGPISANVPNNMAGIVASDFRAAILATNPVGLFMLGEPSGTLAKDECRHSPGTYYGTPTLGTTGLIGASSATAITLASASSQYVDLGATAALDLSLDFSIAALIKGSTVSQWLISHRTAAVASLWGYEFFTDGAGKLNLFWANASTDNSKTLSAASINDGARHFVAVTRAGEVATGYVDALSPVLDLGGGPIGSITSGALQQTVIGARNYSGVGSYTDTIIQAVIFWDYAISAATWTNLELLSRGL